MNIYHVLSACSSNDRYLRRYINYVTACNSQNTLILKHDPRFYTEKHHILPQHAFPEYANFSLNPWNKVLLTYRQHVIAHILLDKFWPCYKNSLSVQRLLASSDLSKPMQKLSLIVKRKTKYINDYKLWLKDNHPFRGKKHSDAARAKMSAVKLAHRKIKLYFLDMTIKVRIYEIQPYLEQGWTTFLTIDDFNYRRSSCKFKQSVSMTEYRKHNSTVITENTRQFARQLAIKNQSCPIVAQKRRQKMQSKKWYHNQTTREVLRLDTHPGPGWKEGRGLCWYNNGIQNKQFRIWETPEPGFTKGRI